MNPAPPALRPAPPPVSPAVIIGAPQQLPAPSPSSVAPPPKAAGSTPTTTTTTASAPTNSGGDDTDVSNVRWSTELVMILVRNCNQDRLTIQRLIQHEITKSKHQGAEVKESTIYQYLNRIKRWAKGVYEADARAGGIYRRDLQRTSDKKLSEADEAAKQDFQFALKREFKSMSFNTSQVLEIINLGKALKTAEEEKQVDDRRKSRTMNEVPFSLSKTDYDSSSSGKKKRSKLSDTEFDLTPPPAPSSSATAVPSSQMDLRAISSAVTSAVGQAMLEYSKLAAKQSQDTANVINSAMQAFLQMQQQAEQRRLEREEKEREERRRERKEERILLKKLLGGKNNTDMEDDEEVD